MENRAKELSAPFGNEEDFDSLLKIYQSFNLRYPPIYLRKKGHCNYKTVWLFYDYTPITPAGAWIRKPWKETDDLPDYNLLFGMYCIHLTFLDFTCC